jgi:hypothetical protein
MKANAMASNPAAVITIKSHGRYKYHKVCDGRKQPIRGLWKRNGKYIARITAEDSLGKKEIRWTVLDEAETIPQAQAALRKLLTKRENNSLPVLKRTPKFSEYVAQYFEHFSKVKDAKRPATIQKERGALDKWKEHLGETRLDRINRAQIRSTPSLQNAKARGFQAELSIWMSSLSATF